MPQDVGSEQLGEWMVLLFLTAAVWGRRFRDYGVEEGSESCVKSD